MDYQSKKDVNVAAEQAKMDAKLAQERAEEAKERGAEASAHSGDSLKKKVQHAANVAKEKATEATNTVKEKATEMSHTAQEKITFSYFAPNKGFKPLSFKYELQPRKILLQRLHIFLHRFPASGSDPAGSTRPFAYKAFFHLDISGFTQLIQLHTEVSRCRLGLLFQVNELSLLHRQQNRHYSQAKL